MQPALAWLPGSAISGVASCPSPVLCPLALPKVFWDHPLNLADDDDFFCGHLRCRACLIEREWLKEKAERGGCGCSKEGGGGG